MDPLLIVIALTVALAVFSLVVGIRASRGSAIGDRLDSFRQDRQKIDTTSPTEGPMLKQGRSYSGLPILGGLIGSLRGSEQAALNLEMAGVPLRVGEYYLLRYVAAALFFFIPFLFNSGLFGVALGVGMAAVGYSLPAVWVGQKKGARTRKMTGQLVELLGMIANSLKSGYGLMQSFEFASKQLDAPISTEIKRTLRDANLGMATEDALQAMGERIAIPDLDMVLTAINIQRAVGGNLAEILENVAHTMRERDRIRGEIATLTAQQRMTGIVIGGLPIGMAALFMLINPEYMGLLFTTTAGRVMLLMAIGLEVLGAMSMKKLLAIEV